MSDPLNELEERVLAGARRAMSPTPADAKRVLAATWAALDAPQAITTSSASAVARGARRALLSRLLAALAIAAVAGSIGYVAGLRGAQSSRPVAPRAEQAATVRDAPKVSNPVTHGPTQVPPSVPENPVRPAARRRPNNAPAPRVDEAQTSIPQDKPSLAAELAAVKRIERALRNGEPDVALELLDELEQTVPDGALGEERTAASVMARCAMGLGLRTTLRHEFANLYPSSAYLERVARACAVDVSRQ